MFICAVIDGPTLFEIKRQLNYASDYADMAELRIDLWSNHKVEDVEKLVKDHPDIPMIFTLRPRPKLSELKRLEEIEQLALLNPSYFDVEDELPSEIKRMLIHRYPDIHWIVSKSFSKYFQDEISKFYENLIKEYPAIFVKIIVPISNSEDALKLCSWIQQQKNPHLLAIATKSNAQTTNILLSSLGPPWIYASANSKKTNPDLSSAQSLREDFHLNKNRPIKQWILNFTPNKTPIPGDLTLLQLYNRRLEELKQPIVYCNLEVVNLTETWSALITLPIYGVVLQHPYNEDVMPLLDYVDPNALKIGAADTVLIEHKSSFGFNTEGISALNLLLENTKIVGETVGVVGESALAKAVILEILNRGGKVVLYSQHHDQGKKIAFELSCEFRSWGQWGDHTIWVNTEDAPIPPSHKNAIVFLNLIQESENQWIQSFQAEQVENQLTIFTNFLAIT